MQQVISPRGVIIWSVLHGGVIMCVVLHGGGGFRDILLILTVTLLIQHKMMFPSYSILIVTDDGSKQRYINTYPKSRYMVSGNDQLSQIWRKTHMINRLWYGIFHITCHIDPRPILVLGPGVDMACDMKNVI
jgi:hypothetical protein